MVAEILAGERTSVINTPEKKENNRNLIIGLHGAVGSGKTELGRLLKRQLGLDHFEEKFPENPYLRLFYGNPSGFSYLMECWFLEAKVKQMRSIPETAKEKGVVIDPALWQDAEIYAWVHHRRGWMTDNQYKDYLDRYEGYCHYYDLPTPDMVIFIQASTETIKKRIRKRNRPYEIMMLRQFPDYFSEIASRAEEWARENCHQVPIVTIDSDNHNYVVNPATQALVIKKLQLEITRISSNFDKNIQIPPQLKYTPPNFDPSAGQAYLKR
jgi:deoxyadenosine/deoxycytidine kinase